MPVNQHPLPTVDLDALPPFPDLPTRRQLIWLASYPKSGNTWLRLLASAYLSNLKQVDINRDLTDNQQCNNPTLAAQLAKKAVDQFSSLDCARVRTGIQRLYASSPQKLFVKTHSAVAQLYGQTTIDPHSTYAAIHIVRNPLAILPSFARHMGLSLDQTVRAMADPNQQLGAPAQHSVTVLCSSWSAFTRSWIESRQRYNTLTLKYEDLKADTAGTFARVLAHIALPVDQDRLDRAVAATAFDKLQAQDISQGFKERTLSDKSNIFFRSGTTDGWRKELEDRHIVATIERHWDIMEQLGYIPADYQQVFEEVKFNALERLADQGTDLGIYARDLNQLRTKRGIATQLKVKASKRAVTHKQARRSKTSKRQTVKKTFG